MIPWEILGREQAPGGGELVLHHRDGEFVIRVDGRELMSSRSSHSEEEMARLAIARLGDREAPRVLLGGLGMGFTIRAALDVLPARAEVVVAELVPAVIAWNRGPLAPLAGRPLEDPRTHVEPIDVGRLMKETRVRFDVILLDVDNGPEALVHSTNDRLYGPEGSVAALRSLRPGGVLAVWSRYDDEGYVQQLREVGFEAESITIPSVAPGLPTYNVFVARRP
jgi:spermidine synthase